MWKRVFRPSTLPCTCREDVVRISLRIKPPDAPLPLLEPTKAAAPPPAADEDEPPHGCASFCPSDFSLIKTVGTGSFGRVFIARKANTAKDESSRVYAIKRLSKKTLVDQRQVGHVTSEKRILQEISHPFLVKMYGTYQDLYCLYIVMEFVEGGELFSYLRSSRSLSEEQAKFYAAQVVCMFEYLHSRKIVYRDLKPENLLISSNGYLKLADFGFAKFLNGRTYTLCGTPEYIAPEVLLNKGHGFPVDWWSLGILIYEMIAGHPPFYDEDMYGIYKRILAGNLVFSGKAFTKESKSIVRHLLVHDISKRLGAVRDGVSDIRYHRWFKDYPFDELLKGQITPPYIPEPFDIEAVSDVGGADVERNRVLHPTSDPFEGNW